MTVRKPNTIYGKGKTSWSKGKSFSLEHRNKLRLAKLGKPGNNPFTDEIKAKMSGKNNWNWISDRTKIKQYWTERNNPEYKQWRKQVWLRDNFKCKIANPDCQGKITAHHILPWRDYVELRYEVNNGITLCQAHHPRKRKEEAELSPYFQKLVAEMK